MLVAVASALVGGCAVTDLPPTVDPVSSMTASPASTPATFVASRTATGGRCVDGVCESTFAVASDGSWSLVSNAELRSGVLPAAVLAAIVGATASTTIPDAPPFTGTCPSAYDGSELIYAWRDTLGRTQTVSACDRAVPPSDPLVLALDQAQAQARAGGSVPDDMAAQAERALAIAESVVGMAEAEAVETLTGVSSLRLTTRVVARDGVALPVTEDYSPTRVNLTVDDGRVTAVSVG